MKAVCCLGGNKRGNTMKSLPGEEGNCLKLQWVEVEVIYGTA